MANFNPLPYTLTNGTTADATQVMADLNQIVSNGNANCAANGANSDITSLSGLTTPLSVAQGGTGSATGGNFVPTGAGTPWFGNPASPPSGWLYCDGSAVSRATYAALFGVIGTTFGTGDGVTTFNLPDGRGRTFAGFDSGNATGRLTGAESGGVSASTMANNGGEQGHTITTLELAVHIHGVTDPGHTHTVTDPTHNHTINDAGHFHQVNGGSANAYGTGSVGTDAFPPAGPSNTSSVTTGITNNAASTGISNQTNTTGITSTNSTGSGSAHNNVQPTLIVGWIIKT